MDQTENPFDSSQFAPQDRSGTANTGVARIIGTMNIVFAILLLLCGVAYGFYMVVFAMMPTFMDAASEQMAEQREQQIQRLRDEEDAAATDEEKKRIAQERETFEENDVQIPDFSKLTGADDARVRGFFLADLLSGMLLNVAMFISGIGLLSLKNWGRVMAQWVNILKSARLVLLYGILLPFVIVPLQQPGMVEAMREMQKGPNAPNAVDAATGMATGIIVSAITVLVLGLIYPVLSMIMLSRPGVKLACSSPPPATTF